VHQVSFRSVVLRLVIRRIEDFPGKRLDLGLEGALVFVLLILNVDSLLVRLESVTSEALFGPLV